MNGSTSTLPCKERAVRRDPAEVQQAAQWISQGRVVMDYEMMKALMEANRKESGVPRQPELKEFPKPDSGQDWKYLDYVRKERIAA